LGASKVVAGAQGAHRTVDVAFESKSGDALAVFANGTTSPAFATRSGSTWSATSSVLASPSGATVDWISLVPNPTSDEITLLFSDTSHALWALTWNGSGWMSSNATEIETGLNVSDFASFAGAYGAASGNFLVVWGKVGSCSSASDPLYYATKPKGSNAFSSSGTAATNIGSPGPIAMASEPGTDRIAIAFIEWCSNTSVQQNGQNDFTVATWGGTSFLAVTDIDSAPGVNYTTRIGGMPVGVAWASGKAIAVYEASTSLAYAVFTTSWTLPTRASMNLPVTAGFDLLRLTTGDVMLVIEDVNQSLWAKRWDGSSFTDTNNGSSLADGVYLDTGRPFGAIVEP
jgi:hypothetical protein